MELLIIRGMKIRGFMSSPAPLRCSFMTQSLPPASQASCLTGSQWSHLQSYSFWNLFTPTGFAQRTRLWKLKMYMSALLLAGSVLLCLARDGEDLIQNKGFQHQAGLRTGNITQSLSQLAKETKIKSCLRMSSDIRWPCQKLFAKCSSVFELKKPSLPPNCNFRIQATEQRGMM